VTTTVILSGVALAATCAAVVLFARLRALSNERFETALRHIDEHLGALVDHVRSSSGALATAPGQGGSRIEPTLDLDGLLTEVAREASVRCGADVGAAEIGAPGEEPRYAYVGEVSDRALLRATLRSIDTRPFDAMTIDWSHGSASEHGPDALRSALIVPILEGEMVIGAVGVYSIVPAAFDSEQARALQALVDDVTPAIGNARRFLRTEQLAKVDDMTGLRNHRAYAEELDREIARCRRTGRPLSLVIVNVEPDPASRRRQGEGSEVWELACLLTDVTRATDVVCRREKSEFAFLLPETSAAAAGTFLARLSSRMASHSFTLGRPTLVSSGLAEWRSGESGDELDRRAMVALSPAGPPAREAIRQSGADSVPEPARLRSAPGSRDDLAERLERELERSRGRPESGGFSLLLVGTKGEDGDPESRSRPRDVLHRLAERVGDRLSDGASAYLAGGRELALVLPGLDADEAAGTFSVLRDSIRERPLEGFSWPSLYAGSTEADDRDDAEALLSRARGALWQARQAGAWTVVVAAMGAEQA
jgi:diguanylate cyclase (GGDEF)-like protein